MDVRVGLWRKLSAEELMLLNCGVGEDSWESLGLKEIKPVHPKGDQSWVFFGRTDAETETPVLWPPHAKSWLIGKTLMLGGIGGRRRRGRQRMRWLDGITNLMDMSLINSGSWWWTGRPDVLLQFIWSQRDGHDWVTEKNWTEKIKHGFSWIQTCSGSACYQKQRSAWEHVYFSASIHSRLRDWSKSQFSWWQWIRRHL